MGEFPTAAEIAANQIREARLAEHEANVRKYGTPVDQQRLTPQIEGLPGQPATTGSVIVSQVARSQEGKGGYKPLSPKDEIRKGFTSQNPGLTRRLHQDN